MIIVSVFLGVMMTDRCLGASKTYMVDSRHGNDSYSGTSARKAWKTLVRASECMLNPGDKLLFARGSEFDTELVVRYSGNATSPILIGSYGSKELPLPIFTNSNLNIGSYGNCIRLQADYIVVENLSFNNTLAEIPQNHYISDFIDMWQLGAVHIDSTARHCMVRGNRFENCGVGIKSNGEHAIIEGNYLRDCARVLKQWSWGPIGIWLGADHQEVCYNIIQNYRAENSNIVWKTSDGIGADGSAIEIDDARAPKHNIEIHHNFSQDCQGFLEVTYKDVLTAPDYSNLYIHDNISDDYQQFVLLWQGRNCLLEHNTIIRRKRNGNEQGVFRVTQLNSGNSLCRNIIVTTQGITVYNNRPKNGAVISDNYYYSLSGDIIFGKEGPGIGAVIVSDLNEWGSYGARGTDEKYKWFNELIDPQIVLGSPRAIIDF